MSPDKLRLRQQQLLIRSTELRYTLQRDLQGLERPAVWADQLKAVGLWFYQHPQWPAAGLALLLVLKPARLIRWSGRFWWLWKSTQQLRRWRATLTKYLTTNF